MALQVWLPLNENGDLKNQGLADVTVTNNGATYNASGKIGGCYTGFNTGLMTLNKEAMSTLSGEFTISCWIKINSYSSNYQTVWSGCSTSASWKNMIMVLLRNGGGSNLIFCISNNSSATESLCSAGTIELGNWMHITCCYKPGHIITYKNGILVLDYSTSIIPNVSTITSCLIGRDYGSYPNDMNINDFRIYDHCLSPKEVKELSKGLVIHYPLDDGNVTNIAYDCSGYCNNGTITGTLITSTDTPRYDKCYTFGSNKLISTTASGSHILTMSIWAKDAGSIPGDGLMFKDHLGDMALGILSNILYSGKSGGGGAGSVSISNISYTANTWHHWVMVNRNGTYYVYMDGLQVLSGTSGSWGAGSVNALHIGGRSGSSPWPGKLSDFRAYCTALSEDDIKALYQEAAFIDHKGNVGCYLFYEDADSQITKTGQVKTEEFEEISDLSDGVAKVYELKIECNQLIEI